MREQIIEMIKALNEDDFGELMSGINQITFEYGWSDDLDESELIKMIYQYK
jgi:hypothetical protein